MGHLEVDYLVMSSTLFAVDLQSHLVEKERMYWSEELHYAACEVLELVVGTLEYWVDEEIDLEGLATEAYGRVAVEEGEQDEERSESAVGVALSIDILPKASSAPMHFPTSSLIPSCWYVSSGHNENTP